MATLSSSLWDSHLYFRSAYGYPYGRLRKSALLQLEGNSGTPFPHPSRECKKLAEFSDLFCK